MNYSKIVTTLQRNHPAGKDLDPSLSHSLEFDSYDDIEDEVNKHVMNKNMKVVSPEIRHNSAKSKSR
jgi:hypothetical protein